MFSVLISADFWPLDSGLVWVLSWLVFCGLDVWMIFV